MLFLLGINHGLQIPIGTKNSFYSDSQKKEFQKYLIERVLTLNNITFFAEEFSNDQKQIKNIKDTLIEELVFFLNTKIMTKLEHSFIEPSIFEQLKLGIETPKQIQKRIKLPVVNPSKEKVEEYNLELRKHFPARENYWLSILQPKIDNHKNGIVVIGLGHVESFSKLLQSKGIDYSLFCFVSNPTHISRTE